LRKTEQTSAIIGVDWIEQFASSLSQTDLSAETVRGYGQDLEFFRRWLFTVQSPDGGFESLSSIDLMSYRQYLTNVERLKPTTINRPMQAR
jgi:site-specific recombinase XerD